MAIVKVQQVPVTFSPKAVKETVKAACDIARYTEDDPYAGLPALEMLATNIPDLDLFHPWELSAEEAADLAKECEDTARISSATSSISLK